MARKRKHDALAKALPKRRRIGVTPERAAVVEDQWSRIVRNAAALGMSAPPMRPMDTIIEDSDDETSDHVGRKIAELDRWYQEKEQHSESWYDVPTADIERNCIRKFDSSIGQECIPDRVCAVCGQLAPPRTMDLVDEGSDVLEVLKTAGAGGVPVLDQCGVDGRIASVCSQCYAALCMRYVTCD